ncbi:hypothetical protein H70357_24685 [Paenibacillus sp. FSL H7-0357]|uniref:hypothetical protein n=1 Tax=Paenibacillus sp. FSL H7-0357 TaxID=1536774 RepID=UPI0004F7E92B|nr:hypothetical protein [Paenibacillus sp. FSL H7-0357]AIQ19552.1 hypothetical protein H70357_24685 [Paenibacillus sp. FSL H7-0357]
MNQLLTILKKLKAGKRVLIKDQAQRYAILGALNAFQVKTYVDGLFVQIEWQPEEGEAQP